LLSIGWDWPGDALAPEAALLRWRDELNCSSRGNTRTAGRAQVLSRLHALHTPASAPVTGGAP
jgi:hypothetical protein